MCDLCNVIQKDSYALNGDKRTLYANKLYRVYKRHIVHVNLCHTHTIELFRYGESRFLEVYGPLAMEISQGRLTMTARER